MIEIDPVVAPPITGGPASARPGGLAWSLAALLVGTVVAVDPGGLLPTGPLRWTVTTALAGVVCCILVRRPVAIPHVITWLWVALLVVLLLATSNAVDPLHAWIGTPDRRLGFLTWLTFPPLFLAGYACTSPPATRVLLRAGTCCAIALGAWSAAELLGASPLGLEFASSRAGGPFGQPAYLGAACLLFGPLSAAVAFDRDETRWWQRVGGLGAACTILALAGSQTRAAWLGASVAVAAVLCRKRASLRRHRAPAAIAAIAVIATAFVISVVTPLGARATSTFDLDQGTSASRFDEWRTATRVIADHAALGVGPEGYRVVFPQAVDAAYVKAYGVEVYPDRAHNGLLDVTLAGGAAAGLLYAALLVIALRHAWRALGAREPLDLALGGAVIAYIVQQQLLFPLSELDPILWVLIGLLIARTAKGQRTSSRSVRARWLIAPIVVATSLAMFYGAREVAADRALKRAATAGDVRVARNYADDATRLRPDSIRTWYVAARVAQRGDALTDVDAALDRAIRGLDQSPGDPALRVLYGELLTERAARSLLADDILLARRELERLTADAPHDPRLRNAQVTALSLREVGKP